MIRYDDGFNDELKHAIKILGNEFIFVIGRDEGGLRYFINNER